MRHRIHLKPLLPVAVLVFLITLAYYPLSFFIFPTKWDNVLAFMPYRHLAGTWWHSGHLPLWNPYINFGYPMHSDPQGGVWYPVAWLFTLFGEYNFYSINAELVFHLNMAGIGTYLLAKQRGYNTIATVLGGLSFALCGFFVGTNQVLTFIIAGAWLPWVFWTLIAFLQNGNKNYLYALSFFLWLQITGGYPAFTILLGYLLPSFFVVYIFLQKKTIKWVLSNTMWLAVSGLFAVLLALPHLYSIFESLPYITRSTAVEYSAKNMNGGLKWVSFFSFLYPNILVSSHPFTKPDLSLASLFFGSFGLIFAAIGFVTIFKKKVAFGLGVGLILLLFIALGLGALTPVHKWFFYLLPGFDLFRHPYLFVLYALLPLSLLVGRGFHIFNDTHINIKRCVWVLLAIHLVVLGLSFWAVNFTEFFKFLKFVKGRNEFSPFGMWYHLLIPSLFGVIFTWAFLQISRVKNLSKRNLAIASIVFLDLFLALQLNAGATLVYNVPFSQYATFFEAQPKQFTNQSADTPIGSFDDDHLKISDPGIHIWRNASLYKRTTSPVGYNPVVFKNVDAINEGPFADSVHKLGLIHFPRFYTETDSGFVPFRVAGEVFEQATSAIYDFEIGPNKISFKIEPSTKDRRIFVQQNWHKNWIALADNQPISLNKNALGLITLDVSKNTKEVQMHYNNPLLKKIFIFSMALCILFFLPFVKYFLRKQK